MFPLGCVDGLSSRIYSNIRSRINKLLVVFLILVSTAFIDRDAG